MAVSQTDFDTLLANVAALVTAEDSSINTLTGLVQQIIAKGTAAGVDLTAEAATLATITATVNTDATNVANSAAAINAALNPPAPPAAA